ncbi:ferric reductase-like transmembrane domain-containing protein [Nodosilinea sp. P-1105]|uniref:ferric reductase-like transmembrane domain-containing protein n=1 Tax=Nodosilinea sp. P-1105 TaxID=2546229 RepID=UPI00146B2406
MNLANILGFLAVIGYLATLLPSILRVVFPRVRRNVLVIWLTKHRRLVGVSAFGLGLTHGMLLIRQQGLDLVSLSTYRNYFTGFAMLLILTVLSVTSLDWMRRKLKRFWVKLHRLTYGLMVLIPWHIYQTMAGNFSPITHAALWGTGTVTILFLRRKQLEWNRPSKAKPVEAVEPESVSTTAD